MRKLPFLLANEVGFVIKTPINSNSNFAEDYTKIFNFSQEIILITEKDKNIYVFPTLIFENCILNRSSSVRALFLH